MRRIRSSSRVGAVVSVLAAVLLALAGIAVARYVAGVGKTPPELRWWWPSVTRSPRAAPPPVSRGRRSSRSGSPGAPGRADPGGECRHQRQPTPQGRLGPSGLRRFDRAALREPGVRWVIVLEGIHDLGFAGSVEPGAARVTAEDLIGGYGSSSPAPVPRG